MPDEESTSTGEIERRLQQLGRYSRFVRAGLGVILGAFTLAVVVVLPSNLGSVANAVDAILHPLIFVGMGLLLFGIGMHLHLMHLNLIRQLRESSDANSSPAEDEHDS
jgi:hypothetical protein